jgi:progressive ankylosis protein
MVQQIIIRNRQLMPDKLLITFAITVGIACSLILLLVSGTPLSAKAIGWFIGNDPELISRVRPVLLICSIMPLLVSVQNALQGFLVSEGRTWAVNQATWLGATMMLGTAYFAAQANLNGSIAAATGMVIGGIMEIGYLLYSWRKQTPKSSLT